MNKEINGNKEVEFIQSIEFYWRSIAVYSIILIFYMLAFGSISQGTFAISASNPVVILLMMIIIGTTISMIYRISRKRAVIIGHDYIIFKSRFKEKKYFLKDLVQILFAKEKIFNSTRKVSVIKLRVEERKLMIRIRPSSFDDDILLVKMMQDFARKLHHTKKIS
jgi:hypothetical protein